MSKFAIVILCFYDGFSNCGKCLASLHCRIHPFAMRDQIFLTSAGGRRLLPRFHGSVVISDAGLPLSMTIDNMRAHGVTMTDVRATAGPALSSMCH